jgi:hypothetical protein
MNVLTADRPGLWFIPRRYIKFDTFHPAVSKGLPVTRVISRITLQVRHLVYCCGDGSAAGNAICCRCRRGASIPPVSLPLSSDSQWCNA